MKRDRKRCWDVMENMKHQGLPPNNVTCRTPVGQWRSMVVLGFHDVSKTPFLALETAVGKIVIIRNLFVSLAKSSAYHMLCSLFLVQVASFLSVGASWLAVVAG